MLDLAPSLRLTSHWCRVDGEEMHSSTAIGPAPVGNETVVFVHGVTSGAIFGPVAERIAPYAAVWVPDMPGVGASSDFPPPDETSGYCAVLARWMETVGTGPAHFIGQSFGCSIVIELAALRPDLVKSLTVQGLAIEPRRRRPGALAPRWIVNSLQERPKSRALSQGQKEISPGALKRLIGQMLRHRMEQWFERVRCPTLVVHAGRDVLVSLGWAEAVAHAIPGASLAVVPRATHSMPAQAPRPLIEAILPFIVPNHEELRK